MTRLKNSIDGGMNRRSVDITKRAFKSKHKEAHGQATTQVVEVEICRPASSAARRCEQQPTSRRPAH